MLKQVYRFLSILLISNLLFSQAVLSKSQDNTNKSCACTCQHKSLFKRFFGCKKSEEQKPAGNQNDKPVIQKPDDNESHYVTKYGVYFNNDIYNSYPQAKPENKQPK